MNPNPTPGQPPEPTYTTIRVRGRLQAAQWAEWFGGMALEVDEASGETCLSGPIADQAELFGLLSRVRNLGLYLISVRCS